MLRASDKVSDLIFSPGRPPQIEVAGKLVPVRVQGLEKLLPQHTAGIAKLILGTQQSAIDSLEKTGSADLSFSVPGDARFRVNILRESGTHAIEMLVIPMRHYPTLLDSTQLERHALIDTVNAVAGAIDAAYERPGIAVWQNNGVAADQTIAHVHFHVAATLPGGGTERGEVEEISIAETEKIGARRRSALGAADR